jgi:hypothetical protein
MPYSFKGHSADSRTFDSYQNLFLWQNENARYLGTACKSLLRRVPFGGRRTTMSITGRKTAYPGSKELKMKLPLISASIVAYIVLATAWICHTGLSALYRSGAPF